MIFMNKTQENKEHPLKILIKMFWSSNVFINTNIAILGPLSMTNEKVKGPVKNMAGPQNFFTI